MFPRVPFLKHTTIQLWTHRYLAADTPLLARKAFGLFAAGVYGIFWEFILLIIWKKEVVGEMASEQQFCLRWNNHQSTLVAVFDTLLESGTLVDCTLAAEGQYLKAHKVVLSACSPYFELLLSQHNEKHPIVILKDVKFQELKAMMDYMYRGEVNISQDQLGALLKAAESLQIKGLSDSGGGNERETSDRRHSRKEVAPQPPQARSPPLPHSTGLTIEHRRSAQQAAPPVVELPEDSPPGTGPHIGGSREGSVSPIPRKRKRHRRRSSTGEEGAQGLLPMTDSHDQTSSSCELPPQSQPAPAANIPAIISPVVPTPSAISRAASDPLSIGPEEQTEPELKRSSIPSSQPNISAEVLPPDPEPVQKLEPPSEILLEPKSEYLDDTMNEDSVENLTTLDDVDDMDDARPGPSHGGEGSSNQGSVWLCCFPGFAPWHVRATERTTDEVFMAAQEAVGAHRDSQGTIEEILGEPVDFGPLLMTAEPSGVGEVAIDEFTFDDDELFADNVHDFDASSNQVGDSVRNEIRQEFLSCLRRKLNAALTSRPLRRSPEDC
ncbi:Longitudinals lacking protein, isoforms H/M/V [Gryllus bimaculatus]|nr:Longitudinals lacking protein, isoforms H/M/V [Gryllus bimaculatus]